MKIVALAILITPVLLAIYGVKLIRDAFFGELTPIFINTMIQFVAGTVIFFAGLAFIGGYIYNRDRKRKLAKGQKHNRYTL
ncbi:hypothetical protein J416_05373 [Gracilibacillus halophilus YIM-C55.5]|uniref:DUF2627 domain-containing protein n=1 Tax=Gracilibacillus halophilus YIM-C55.5 TaxID=1308866 RepID=N4WML9_9BACI|nr:DUF2627 domain-containing protein [Gracilibacillus halophilus]ENH97417.1 hypothetical protein J416_05373 [Gracilibacillus halophilus YIM-C55.5]